MAQWKKQIIGVMMHKLMTQGKQKREATFKQQKQAATNMLRDGVISIVNTYLETINSHKN